MAESNTRLGILISGRGSNMRALVEASRSGELPAEVVRVISNKPEAPGIEWAGNHGLECRVVSHRGFESREDHDREIVSELRAAGVHWVCLAGYMRLLSPVFVEAFPQRILNIHPSLLPAFPGLNSQAQAWNYGVRWTGCTVHLVDAELDHGPIVDQQAVSIDSCSTVSEVEAAILAEEHCLYVRALSRLLSEPWNVHGRRVVFQSRG